MGQQSELDWNWRPLATSATLLTRRGCRKRSPVPVQFRLQLATACDIRYASDKARLGEVAVPAGFVPESGGARNLPKLVGIGRAMEMILTGEVIDAAEAQKIGLVERVFPHDKLLEEVLKIAQKIATAPFLSVR